MTEHDGAISRRGGRRGRERQYDGRCNRVSVGLLSLLDTHLGMTGKGRCMSYKTLERASI